MLRHDSDRLLEQLVGISSDDHITVTPSNKTGFKLNFDVTIFSHFFRFKGSFLEIRFLTLLIVFTVQQSLGVKNGLLSTTTTNHQMSKSSNNIDSGGLMTVFNAHDGTLSLSLETARSLGIEMGPSSTTTLVQQVSKGPPASAPSVVLNAPLLPSSISDGTVTYILQSPAVTW